MRMMALGASGLALALVLAGVSPSGTTAFQIAVEGFALASAPLFLIAVGPPKLLLAAWRRDADAELQHTLAGLVSAVTPQEVASALLPHATQALGGRGSVLVDREGHVIGAHGIDRDQAAEIARGNVTVVSRPEGDSSIVDFPLQEGRLLVEASVFTPYFGREEIMYMGALAGLIDLALARSRLSAQERIVLAELQSANETMRDFVAIASHDLRTPISVIRGFADVLASDGGSISHEERRSYLDAIGRQSDHLARLVEDLLTVSRIDARAVEPRPAAVDVESAVRRAVQDSRHAAGEILVETTPGLRANADPEHLARILQNYIDNAFAYGRPPVRVTTSGNGSSVQIRVIDAGVGVPPEFVPRMFEKFARADKAKSSKAQGTGLGLSIVRGLARAGGGEAWYERAPSGGACFVVSFPRVEASGG
jgi:signal transduction histidine kinase